MAHLRGSTSNLCGHLTASRKERISTSYDAESHIVCLFALIHMHKVIARKALDSKETNGQRQKRGVTCLLLYLLA